MKKRQVMAKREQEQLAPRRTRRALRRTQTLVDPNVIGEFTHIGVLPAFAVILIDCPTQCRKEACLYGERICRNAKLEKKTLGAWRMRPKRRHTREVGNKLKRTVSADFREIGVRRADHSLCHLLQ